MSRLGSVASDPQPMGSTLPPQLGRLPQSSMSSTGHPQPPPACQMRQLRSQLSRNFHANGGRQTTHKIISESNTHSEEKKSMREA